MSAPLATPLPPLKSHKFVAGTDITYVCYGEDPTYDLKAQRPVFLVFTDRVASVARSGVSFLLVGKGESDRHIVSHFEDRTALSHDAERLTLIIDHMRAKMVEKFVHYAKPGTWAQPQSPSVLARYATVAEQYRSGDIEIVTRANTNRRARG